MENIQEDDDEDVPDPLIDDNSNVSKGIVTNEDGSETHTVDTAQSFVSKDQIVLKYHKYERMDAFYRDTKKVTGKPLRQGDADAHWNEMGQIKFFYHDLCTYIDDMGITRIVRLKNHNLRNKHIATLSANTEICKWEDDC